jgi:hypothetical protein
MADVGIMIGRPSNMPLTDAESAAINAQTQYQSEYGQGTHAFYAGIALAVIGIIYENNWVIAAGVFIGLVGRARMGRASDVKSKQDLAYAASLGQ